MELPVLHKKLLNLLNPSVLIKKGVTISFRNSMILVAIPDSKNRFEADVWSSLSDMSILKSDFVVLQSLLEIVDELNLNTRIWSKE